MRDWIRAVCLLPMLSCCLSGTPVELPDVFPAGIVVDDTGHLIVTIENQGRVDFPAGVGKVMVWVDGNFQGIYFLASIPDQGFLSAGQSSDLDTGIFVAGINRRVAVMLDSDDEVAEWNELQNTLTKTITAFPGVGSDLDIESMATGEEGELVISVVNRGELETSGERVLVSVDVDGESSRLVLDVPPLEPGPEHAVALVPEPALVIKPTGEGPALVRARLHTDELTDEIDTSNGFSRAWLPLSLWPYEDILSREWVRSRLKWFDANGTRDYDQWTQSEKDDLFAAITALETGASWGPSGPPALVKPENTHYLKYDSDAWEIFLHHVAHAMFLDVRRLVPWTLFPEHLRFGDTRRFDVFLDATKLYQLNPQVGYHFNFPVMASTTPWNPRIPFEFFEVLGLIRGTQEETIYAFTEWMRAYVRHVQGTDDPQLLYNYPGRPPIDLCLYSRVGMPHVATGCWGASGIYYSAMKSVNIPAVHEIVTLWNANHSRPHLTTAGLTMSHGDDVYTSTFTPSGAYVPVEEIFVTTAEYDTLYGNPVLDCDGNDCNTLGEQATYNATRRGLQICHDYGGDDLLNEYSLPNGAQRLEDRLTGIPSGGQVIEFAFPFFTPAERAAMIATADTRLAAIGDGDPGLGAQILWHRVVTWSSNRQ